MLKQITINGTKVFYSKKYVKTAYSTMISFTDGSWCDVKTGKIINRGKGYLTIGNPPKNTDRGEKQTVTKSFTNVTELTIKYVTAIVDMQVHDKDEIEVILEGFNDDLDEITVTQKKNSTELIIEGQDKEAASENLVFSTMSSGSSGFSPVTRIRNWSRGASPITRTIESSDPSTKLTVKVPSGTGVAIDGINGTTTIGDTKGPLSVHNNSIWNVIAGHVGNTNIKNASIGKTTILEATGRVLVHNYGSGDVKLVKINSEELNVTTHAEGNVIVDTITAEYVDATVGGSGKVLVQIGSVKSIVAHVTSFGDFTFKGTAQTADLHNSGSGAILLHRVEKSLISHQSDSGTVQVRAGEIERLTVQVSGSGDFIFNGTAKEARLNGSSIGNIRVQRVLNQPVQHHSGSGKIRVQTIS